MLKIDGLQTNSILAIPVADEEVDGVKTQERCKIFLMSKSVAEDKDMNCAIGKEILIKKNSQLEVMFNGEMYWLVRAVDLVLTLSL